MQVHKFAVRQIKRDKMAATAAAEWLWHWPPVADCCAGRPAGGKQKESIAFLPARAGEIYHVGQNKSTRCVEKILPRAGPGIVLGSPFGIKSRGIQKVKKVRKSRVQG